MRTLGLRGRVILGFAAGALLLSVLVTLVTDVVSARYLVDQRERAASRQAVVNGLFVESRLTRDGADPSGALGAVRLGTGAEAVLVAPEASASTAIGLTSDDLPTDLVAATEAGQPSVQISRSGGTPVVTVGVPLQGGYAYYEVTELGEPRYDAADDHLGRRRSRAAHLTAGGWPRLVGGEQSAASAQRRRAGSNQACGWRS